MKNVCKKGLTLKELIIQRDT